MTPENTPYPKADFREPSPSGYLYIALSVAPPRGPLPRRSAERDDAVQECLSLAWSLAERDDVLRARVFEAVLMPPLRGAPGFDVTMLVEAASPEDLEEVRRAAAPDRLGADLVMPARNPVRIGDTEHPADGTYLFNHFRAADGDTAADVWEELTGWYTAKTGVDNSTPLRALEESPFPLVNYARLPTGAVSFLLRQLPRPSFHRFVRARLKANGMTALPVLYLPA
ncbi:hypothetical protein A6A08_18630 [Nocardiopsis sp. TSRI0078]|uniref:hypothetical protein n=1 Tax=unclassified Nocardiopsis TaxID=2649073 RepID=UPI00093FF8FD|nr:hypothetical protein [Nocardiopsis sp. TSRI0078]OKI22958.1 hypothetical protein A6A08_18630 [Nocardiopsis sp. TSRI0078]